jgi:serine/threonine-protein kinase HipA
VADPIAVAEVRLWGATVGAVAETGAGRIVFEYADEFRRTGLAISPLNLPLSRRGPVAFDELRRKVAFNGLPGVLADALPDSFGNAVIRAYFAARGDPDRALSPVQRLLYVGERALSALTFHPATPLVTRPAELEPLEIAALVRDARRIIDGEAGITIPEIYRIGSSAGGMRAKAIVLYNAELREIRSGFAPARPGDVPCLIKFDGVGVDAAEGGFGRPLPFNRVEAAYARMATDAGLVMSEISVIESDGGYVHLLIRRFDLDAGARIHQHTLGGLLHVDYNDVGASSYEEYLRAILRLGMAQACVEQGFLRAVFNVVAVNQDDHVKNLSFHMRPSGEWSLTPAYDVTFACGHGFTAAHQMRVEDKLKGITASDLRDLGSTFGIRAPGRIVDRAESVVMNWPRYAKDAGVPADVTSRIETALQERRRSLREP